MKYTIETVDRSNTVRTFICEQPDEVDHYSFFKAFDNHEPIRLKTVQGSSVFINVREISHMSITPYVEPTGEAVVTSSS